MVPKLHRGSSFRGLAAYVLHDKDRATTAHRVGWTEVRNLATSNPQAAWRVMAATAMDQDRLKAAAGIKNTGRKSKEHVLHLMLSWHPDESVSREEMMQAAVGAIRALKADEHQALICSHVDEPQAHLHIMLNRVSPADGRMLSSSKEKLALSRWAEKYEKARGRIFCEERVLNNAARDRGEFVRGEPDQPRHLLEQQAAHGGHEPYANVMAEEKKKDAAVSQKARDIKSQFADGLKAIDASHRQRMRDIRTKSRQALQAIGQAVRVVFPSRSNETEQSKGPSFLSRMFNAFKAIDLGKMIRKDEAKPPVQIKRSRQSRTEAAKLRKQRGVELAQARDLFVRERQTLQFKLKLEIAYLRAAWKTRYDQRTALWHRVRSEDEGAERSKHNPGPPNVRSTFDEAARTDQHHPRHERPQRLRPERPSRPRRPGNQDGREELGRERE